MRFAPRSGGTAEPDEELERGNDWSDLGAAGGEAELAVEAIRPGRYLQWRAEPAGDGRVTPRLVAVEVSDRQENLRPRIELGVDPGRSWRRPASTAADQVSSRQPDARGMFTSRRLATLLVTRGSTGCGGRLPHAAMAGRGAERRPARVRAGVPPRGADDWPPMAEELTDGHHSSDAAALPDGVDRFRPEPATGAQPGDEPLVDQRVSERWWSTTGRRARSRHAAPVLAAAEVADDLSPLRTARRASTAASGGRWWWWTAC